MPFGHGRRAAVVAASLTLLLSGCGSSTHHASSTSHVRRAATASVCTPKGRAAVTGFFGNRVVTVTTHQGIASSGSPTCYYDIKLSRGAPLKLSVQVDRTVEAYFLLERAITEFQQVFTPTRLSPAPQQVPHVGLDASWFPAEHYVMTTDGVSLITATVGWRVAVRRQRALATAAARAYLGRLDWKAAENTY